MLLKKKKINQRVNMESKRKSEDTLKLLYTLDKGGKSTELRGKKVSSMQCWKSWTDAYKSRKSEQSLTPYINSINTILFSRRSSQPRDWAWVSCIADRFFTIWATGEAPNIWHDTIKLLEDNLGKTFSDIKVQLFS